MKINHHKGQPYTLGLDIGIASVGAAILGKDRIFGLHVRTFEKAETAKEGESLNKIRRESRLSRRRIRRRAHRMLRLLRLMKRVGLIDKTDTEVFRQGAKNPNSPWDLRFEGLDRKLEPAEWASVIYHIIKHRGFQSTRKSELKNDKKVGQMLSGVDRNKALLLEKNYRTIGELACKDIAFNDAKRNKRGNYQKTFSRDELAHELDVLFKYQHQYGNCHADELFKEKVYELLMARKRTLSGERLIKMIGSCTFEPTEKRAPKAGYRAERFVWLGKLNNLKISCRGTQRAITDIERKILIELPFESSKLTYKQIRKKLELNDNELFNFVNYRINSKEKNPEDVTFFEAKYFHTLRNIYKNAGLEMEWLRDALNPDRLDTIAYAMTCYKNDIDSRAWLKLQGIEDNIIEAVLELSCEKVINLSTVALKKILPYMEQGLGYDEAVAAIPEYQHHSHLNKHIKKTIYLPPLSKDEIRNPVVYRALNQARKLFNAIVREYGSPTAVHIELARDLSKSKKERDEVAKGQNEFREEKERAVEHFKELFEREPKGSELLKFRLYKEQDGQCAYSHRPIDDQRLLEESYVEIDHILPYSRSFDDSKNNQVLVLTCENRNKGNRTPYEYLEGKDHSERWEKFVAWVEANKKIRKAKKDRLLRKDFRVGETLGFRERHLSDTRYICRMFKKLIEDHVQFAPKLTESTDDDGHYVPPIFNERCVVVSGQLTNHLRSRWGLVKIREDGDLHHALDAAVIAACSHGMVKRLSDYSRRKEMRQLREMSSGNYSDPETGEIIDSSTLNYLRKIENDFPKPWPHYREELLAFLSPNPAQALIGIANYSDEERKNILPMRVSRMPTRRGLGSAHEETIRSIGKNSKLLNNGYTAIKTPLTDLKLQKLENIVGYDDIRNIKLIEAIRERLIEYNDDGKKAFSEDKPLYKPSGSGKKSPQIRSVKLKSSKKSGIRMREGIAYNGDMLRIDIFIKANKFFVVPLYVSDAVVKVIPNRAAVVGKPYSEWPVMDETFTFLFSLYKNDWVRVLDKNSARVREGYFCDFDRSTTAISLWLHDRNSKKSKNGKVRGIGIKSVLAVEKYHVDFLGNLHKATIEIRQPLSANQLINLY
jgi:CRISPR-associated endonuclease Csn1